ncbi:MAG: ATP-dependent zinc protease [Gammaproteobacteria bacterium]|nr:ATP-dependent zinc protease [Gammaproteobacteria bacterium]
MAAANDSLVTIGWIEPIRIMPEGFDLQAKIDTGADNSSLGVVDWESFMRNSTEWIRFKVRSNNGQLKSFERPLERHVLIKRKQSQPLKRPVVNLWLCLGKNRILTEVNLSKRKNFKFRMLIGRSLLKNRFLVNSALKFTQPPECQAVQ